MGFGGEVIRPEFDGRLHLFGEINGLLTRLLQFGVDTRANEGPGARVVVRESRGANRAGIEDSFVEHGSGSGDFGGLGGSEAHGFGDCGSVFGVAGVELGVENARLIGVDSSYSENRTAVTE